MSDFTIPRDPKTMMDALEVAQRDYERARARMEKALQSLSDAEESAEKVKNDLKDDLMADRYGPDGTTVVIKALSENAADKAYKRAPAWLDVANVLRAAKSEKNAAEREWKIASHRQTTLKSACDLLFAFYEGKPIPVEG